jgi:hypothetical protein
MERKQKMTILIVSDTHRKHQYLEEQIKRMGQLDMLIHLGDVEGAADYIRGLVDCPVEIVAGNNDFYDPLPREREITIGKYKVLLTHGHYLGVNFTRKDIIRYARSLGAGIVMFGHTHKPVIEYDDDVIALNPGSIGYPRQENKRPSCIVMEIDKEGEAHFQIQYL